MSTQLLEREWSRDYTAFMRCDAGDNWLPEVERQAGSWLRGKKKLDIDLHRDGELVDGDRTVTVRRSVEGAVRDLSVSLVERNTEGGTWTTHLLAHDERGAQDWIFLQVTNDQGNFVATPLVAKYLMQALPLGDGSIDFVDKPQMFRAPDVGRLVELLADQRRHGLVFVAGTDDRLPVDAFKDQVGEWARQVYGLAQVVILDPSATEAFGNRVGNQLATPAWTIRTYKPGVDFSAPRDGWRHRILGTERLVRDSDGRIRYLLGDIARSHANERDLPKPVLRTRRRFERLENRKVLDDALSVPAPRPASDLRVVGQTGVDATDVITRLGEFVEGLEGSAQLDLVRRVLKLDQITEAALNDIAARLAHDAAERDASSRLVDRIEAMQSQIELLEDRNAADIEMLKDEQLDHELTRLDLDDRNGRIRWLENRLKKAGDFEANYRDTPPEFSELRPADFSDLLDQIDAMQGVMFTGDPEEAVVLTAVDSNGAALRTAWEAVLALQDYARSRREGVFDASLSHYLDHTPNGYHTFPPGKFAETESGQTMRQFGDERLFPVPASFDPAGIAPMKAHFKLASIGTITPRMHILDGHPASPVVYIGYIGRHLTNTKTRSM